MRKLYFLLLLFLLANALAASAQNWQWGSQTMPYGKIVNFENLPGQQFRRAYLTWNGEVSGVTNRTWLPCQGCGMVDPNDPNNCLIFGFCEALVPTPGEIYINRSMVGFFSTGTGDCQSRYPNAANTYIDSATFASQVSPDGNIEIGHRNFDECASAPTTMTLHFEYVPSVPVVSYCPGYTPVGASFTIMGTSLAAVTAVKLNGQSLSFSLNKFGYLEVIAPATSQSGNLALHYVGGSINAGPMQVGSNLTTTTSIAVSDVRTLTNATYYQVWVNSGGVLTVNGTLGVRDELKVRSGGTLIISPNAVLFGTANFAMEAGAHLIISSPFTKGSSQWGLSGNYTVYDKARFTYRTNGNNINSGADQPQYLAHFTVEGGGTLTLDQNLYVRKNLIVDASILDANNKTVMLRAGDFGHASLYVSPIAGMKDANNQLLNADNFVMQRYISPSVAVNGGSWQMLAVNAAGQNLNAWNSWSAYGANTFGNQLTTNASLYLYDNSLGGPQNGWYKGAGPGTAAPLGTGAWVYLRSQDFFNTKLGVGSLTGRPAVGSFPFQNLTRCTGPTCAGGNDNGFHLIGNPFMARLNWASSNVQRSNVANAIYTYDHQQGVYSTWVDGIAVNGGSPIIGHGQGFLIETTGLGSSVLIQESAKVAPDTLGSPYLAPRAVTGQLINLALVNLNSGLRREAVVRLHPTATAGYDAQFDAAHLGGNFSLGTMAAGRALAVNSLPANQASYVIPLSVNIASTGVYGLDIQNIDALLGQYAISVVDSLTGTRRAVTASGTLPFRFDAAANLNNRYHLVLEDRLATAAKPRLQINLNISPNPVVSELMVSLSTAASGKFTVEIYNAAGQLVHQAAGKDGMATTNVEHLSAGVYIVKAQSADFTTTAKLVKK